MNHNIKFLIIILLISVTNNLFSQDDSIPNYGWDDGELYKFELADFSMVDGPYANEYSGFNLEDIVSIKFDNGYEAHFKVKWLSKKQFMVYSQFEMEYITIDSSLNFVVDKDTKSNKPILPSKKIDSLVYFQFTKKKKIVRRYPAGTYVMVIIGGHGHGNKANRENYFGQVVKNHSNYWEVEFLYRHKNGNRIFIRIDKESKNIIYSNSKKLINKHVRVMEVYLQVSPINKLPYL